MNDFQRIIAEKDYPVIIADKDGMIIQVNEAFNKCFAWTEDALIGQMTSSIIPENLRDAHNLGFSRFLISEKPTLLNKDLDLEILKGDGKTIKARHFISAQKDPEGWTFAAKIIAIDDSA